MSGPLRVAQARFRPKTNERRGLCTVRCGGSRAE